MRLIPSIDLRGGRCVRLLHGDFDAETRYDLDPGALLQRYRAMGADWLHVVDLDGARDGVLANRDIIIALAADSSVSLQVGGGVRSRGVLEDLLSLGVARVAVGSAAVEAPDEVRQWLRDFGPERVCLAFDVSLDQSGEPLLRTRGWREATVVPLWRAVSDYADAGLLHVLCTDIARDGALGGPNFPLYAEAVARFPGIAWQASGGVSSAADLQALAATGVAAAISGKALLEQRMTMEELQPFLPAA
jgi:phosphoribosylformimino-5-aminoimidazole carboxamide ribotide isomerase